MAFIPIAPAFPDASLDGSWGFALNAAVARRLGFGRDIVFTFGPYASAYTGLYHPATDARMLWSSAILAVAFAAGLICLTTSHARIWLAVPLACSTVLMPKDSLFLALPLLLLILSCRVAMDAGRHGHVPLSPFVRLGMACLVAAAALLPLVKGTFGAATGIALSLSAVVLWRCQRAVVLFGAALLFASLTVFWCVAGQPVGSLPGFFVSLLPIMSGYTDAMSMDGPVYQTGLYVLGCGVLLAACRATFAEAGRPGQILLLGMALLLFLAFKEGFVRQDGHVFIAAWFLVLAGGLFLLGDGVRPALIGIVGCTLASVLLSDEAPRRAVATFGARIGAPFHNAEQALTMRVLNPGALAATYATHLARIRADLPLPRLQGRVDIYPIDQAAVLAQDFAWSPRPVLQSYSAYTPSLARLDAAHLTGPAAPDTIVFSIQPFGDRLATQDDGASWPVLLSRYDVNTYAGDALILRRSKDIAASPIAAAPLSDRMVRLGEPLALPIGTAPLWANVQVTPTLLGRAFGLAYKPPRLNIAYRFADGSEDRFRYTAAMGEGFLLSPVVRSTRDFLALRAPGHQDRFAGRRPVSVVISAEYGSGWLWHAAYRARLFTLALTADANAGALLPDPALMQAENRAGLPRTDDCGIDRIDAKPLPDGVPKIGTHVRVDGWAAVSARHGDVGTGIALTLTASNGQTRVLHAQRMARPDVNTFFERPDMAASGFVAEGDFALPDGDYSLGVDVETAGRSWVCTRRLLVHVAR